MVSAVARLEAWSQECDRIDLEDAVQALAQTAGELLELLAHRVKCKDAECTDCATDVDVRYYSDGTDWTPSLAAQHERVSTLLERVR